MGKPEVRGSVLKGLRSGAIELALGETFRHLINRCRGVHAADLGEMGVDEGGGWRAEIRWR